MSIHIVGLRRGSPPLGVNGWRLDCGAGDLRVGLNQADLEAPLGQLVERVVGETALEEERHHRPCEMDWISEREIGDTDPSRGAEREAGFYGQAFLIEMVLRQHGGVG